MAHITDGRLVPSFSLAEMSNPSAPEPIKLVITPAAVRHAQMMQELRTWFNKPMTVNSWYRTPLYNKQCGGESKSCHMEGIATDIGLRGLTDKQIGNFKTKWQAICKKHGVIGGMSIYPWGLHFDSNEGPKRYKSGSAFRVNDNR